MEIYGSENKKKELIEKTWQFLLKTGISNASIGALCKDQKISQSSLYYWFKNKDDIWISAGKYGLGKVVDSLFDYTLSGTQDIRNYFNTLLDEVEKYQYDLRLALQITTSPVFGDRMRNKSREFNQLYTQFGEKLVTIFGCTPEDAQIFVYRIITVVQDYAIWNDRKPMQMLLDSLCDKVLSRIKIYK